MSLGRTKTDPAPASNEAGAASLVLPRVQEGSTLEDEYLFVDAYLVSSPRRQEIYHFEAKGESSDPFSTENNRLFAEKSGAVDGYQIEELRRVPVHLYELGRLLLKYGEFNYCYLNCYSCLEKYVKTRWLPSLK